MHKNIILLYILFFTFLSCEDKPEPIASQGKYTDGVFIINEGNFRAGNAEVSFFDETQDTVYHNIYVGKNGKKLGDVAMHMVPVGNKFYLVVNNSGKIEVLEKESFKQISSISGLISPRYFLQVTDSTAWVSDLSERAITLIGLKDNNIIRKISVPRTLETMLLHTDYVYACAWRKGNVVYKLDKNSGEVLDSVVVHNEPNSMAIDADNQLWVLSDGGVLNRTQAALSRISLSDFNLVATFPFSNTNSYPSRLLVDHEGLNLYFIDNHVYKMGISDTQLPTQAFAQSTGQIYYGMSIHPGTGNVYVTDAKDYISHGSFSVYTHLGQKLYTHTTGIIPAYFAFVGN